MAAASEKAKLVAKWLTTIDPAMAKPLGAWETKTSQGGAVPANGAPAAPPSAVSTTVKAPQPGSGGEWHDASKITFTPRGVLSVGGRVRSESTFPSGKSGVVELNAGQSGKVTLSVKIEGFQDNVLINEDFTQELSVSWDISADDSGTLTIDQPQETWGAPSSGTYYRLDSVNPGQGKSFVQVSPVIVGGADSGGISAGVGVGRQAQPPKIKETFRLDIKVNVPKKRELQEKVMKMPPVFFSIGPFKVGSAKKLESGALDRVVYDILYKGLLDDARKALIQGQLQGGEKIEVHGHASNTGPELSNLNLSKERATEVIKAFTSLGVPRSAFSEPIPHGEWETKHPTDDKSQEKEDPAFRRVMVIMKLVKDVTVKV
jgi:outer membrane protein OmpA-like peptidoglycan-associated protein